MVKTMSSKGLLAALKTAPKVMVFMTVGYAGERAMLPVTKASVRSMVNYHDRFEHLRVGDWLAEIEPVTGNLIIG